jgi:hypothetical protein
MHIHDWRVFFILARMREEPGPTFMSPSSRSRWYRECQRTKRHRLVSNWRCLRGAGGPHSIQSGRSFPRTGSCVHIRRAPLREETLMEKEAEMPVTADQRPPWNTQRRPEDGSPRSTAAAACRAARRVCRGHASAPMAARWDSCTCRRARVLRPAIDNPWPNLASVKSRGFSFSRRYSHRKASSISPIRSLAPA